MACCPFRSPSSFSSLFCGGSFRSVRTRPALSMSRFPPPPLMRLVGQTLPAPPLFTPSKTSPRPHPRGGAVAPPDGGSQGSPPHRSRRLRGEGKGAHPPRFHRGPLAVRRRVRSPCRHAAHAHRRVHRSGDLWRGGDVVPPR